MSIDQKTDERKDDNPFDPKNHRLYNEYMNIRAVLDKTNVENGIDMSAADLGRTTLSAMRYLKAQELSRNNRLDPDSPIDGASLSRANPHTGVAAGQYIAFYQGTRDEYEKLRVQGVPTSELGHPAHVSMHDIRTIEAELQQQRQMTMEREQTQQRDRNRDDQQQNAPSAGVRTIFS